MSLDHDDSAAVDAFVDRVERAIDDAAPGHAPWTLALIAVWVAVGAALTLALRADGAAATLLYVVAAIGVAGWVAGFYLARGRARWFGA
jgi:hypothetical protein